MIQEGRHGRWISNLPPIKLGRNFFPDANQSACEDLARYRLTLPYMLQETQPMTWPRDQVEAILYRQDCGQCVEGYRGWIEPSPWLERISGKESGRFQKSLIRTPI